LAESANHHAIHQDAGNLHLTWVERTALDHSFDLGNHQTAAVARSHGDGQALDGQRLTLETEVAVGIAAGGADDADMHRKGWVEQVILAVDGHQPHQIGGGACIELAATVARVDVGAEANA
jgi:hypothetical protein